MKNRENLKNKILTSAFVVVIVIGLFLIFKDGIKDYYINHFIIPFFSKFQDHNVWCGIWILTISIFICLYVASKQWRSCAYPKIRYLYEFVFLAFTFLVYFVFSTDIVLNSVFEFQNNSCVLQYLTSYINEFWICVFVVETILGLKIRKNKSINTNSECIKESAYLYDQPTDKDDFNRHGYAEVVVKKIIATFNEEKNKKSKIEKGVIEKNNDKTDSNNGAFVINISESYGYGKSSFILLLEEEARAYTDKNEMVLFEYKPWLCENPQKIISEFFNLLNENLSKYIPNIGKSINKYVHLLLEYYSSKNALAYVLSNCFKEQPSIFKERGRLKNDIQKLNKPIVIIIDDVDRLRDEELLTLFSLLRNTADFPNVFYILAADMTYVKQVLKCKDVEDQEGYIKKFINYEFLIPGFNIDIMGKVLDETLRSTLERVKDDFKKDDGNFVNDIIDKIWKNFSNDVRFNMIFTNIRDIKRFCNNYATAIDCYIHCNYERITHLADDIDLSDLFAIELLKYLSEDTYKILRDRDDLILKPSEGIQPKGSMIYALKEEYQKIIPKIVTTRVDKNKDEPSKQENQEHENDSIKSILDKNKNISKDNTICLILRYLFEKDYSKLGVNSINYRDAYFRYFSYRFKNNQMSVNEVIYMIKNLSIDNYKTELKKIVKAGKSDSFVHKLPFLKNEGSLDTGFIDKLFLFVEECTRYINENEITQSNMPSTEKGIYEIKYGISYILFKWYLNTNYQKVKDSKTFLNTLKKNMTKFILENSHADLLCLFIKYMLYYDNEDILFFSKLDVLYWASLFLNRCVKDKKCDIFDQDKKDLITKLRDNIQGFRYMSFFIIREGKHYTLNILFIANLFDNLNNAIEYINLIHGDNITCMSDILDLNSKAYLNSNAAELKEELLSSFNEDGISKERIKNHLLLQYKNTGNIYIFKNKANFKSDVTELKEDLISLLKKYDISDEKIEDHPFLQYVEMVNKMYLWDGDLQKLASSVQ